MAEAADEYPPWIDLGAYAERTGQHLDAVRSAVRRGRLKARKGNDGRWLVPMPDEGAPQLDEGTGSATATPDAAASSSLAASVHEAMTALRSVLTEARAAESQARAEAVRLRDDLAASDVARAVAEAKVAATDELLAELRRALEHERARAPGTEADRHRPDTPDGMQAELEEAQRQLKARDLMLDALRQPLPPRPWWRRLIAVLAVTCIPTSTAIALEDLQVGCGEDTCLINGGAPGARWQFQRRGVVYPDDNQGSTVCGFIVWVDGLNLDPTEERMARLTVAGIPFEEAWERGIYEAQRAARGAGGPWEEPGDVKLFGGDRGMTVVSDAGCGFQDKVEAGTSPVVLSTQWDMVTFDLTGAPEALRSLRLIQGERLERAVQWEKSRN